jgi:hypothetical protein
MKRITLDTNVIETDGLVEAAQGQGFELSRITVTDREVEGTQYQVHLAGLGKVAETAVWGESRWDEAVWASGDSSLEKILQIISNGSFPRTRESLSAGHRRQLRDAMILDAHIRQSRDIFVTNDRKGFIRDGRRQELEATFKTKIMALEVFKSLLQRAAAQQGDAPDGATRRR